MKKAALIIVLVVAAVATVTSVVIRAKAIAELADINSRWEIYKSQAEDDIAGLRGQRDILVAREARLNANLIEMITESNKAKEQIEKIKVRSAADLRAANASREEILQEYSVLEKKYNMEVSLRKGYEEIMLNQTQKIGIIEQRYALLAQENERLRGEVTVCGESLKKCLAVSVGGKKAPAWKWAVAILFGFGAGVVAGG